MRSSPSVPTKNLDLRTQIYNPNLLLGVNYLHQLLHANVRLDCCYSAIHYVSFPTENLNQFN